MVQTVSRTRECDDTRIRRKSDLRIGDMCEKGVINKQRTGQVRVYWTDAWSVLRLTEQMTVEEKKHD
jgi:hypothetical protein